MASLGERGQFCLVFSSLELAVPFLSSMLKPSSLAPQLRKRLHTRSSDGFFAAFKPTDSIDMRERFVWASGDEIALYPPIAIALLEMNGGRL